MNAIQVLQVTRVLLCSTFLLVNLIPYAHPLFGQNKKALLVAIGNYPKESGFRKISSLNDIDILKSTLVSLGMEDKNIVVLVDSQATKLKIKATIEKIIQELIKAGDIFYFHFSGHGQQVQDLNGDEIDGYDESIVPYDARSEYVEGVYEGQNHIIDDELGILLDKIRKKLGPTGHLVTCIDACHSGTSTRNIGISRGVDVALASPEFLKKKGSKPKELSQMESRPADESKMASMVSFFASMANQLNYEILAEDGQNYGALSYAFSKSIREISSGSSYQQLFDRIKIHIQAYNSSQIPEAIGTLSQEIFGGKILTSVKYFLVKEFINSNTVILNAGFLQGFRPGCIVGLYAPESRGLKTDSLITSAMVESSQINSCKLSIKNGITKENALRAWVKIREDNFGDLKIKLQLKGNYSLNVRPVLDSIINLPFVDRVENNPDLVIFELNNQVSLVTNRDIELLNISTKLTERDIFYKLKSNLINYGQTQFIKKIEQENKDIKLEIEILLANKRAAVQNDLQKNIQKFSDGRITFKLLDSIQIEVVNKGSKSAYYSLLDIQPNFITSVLVPRRTDSPSDYYIEPGQKIKIPIIFRLDPPFGQELFKLIASRNPIDLRSLEQKRGVEDTKEFDPFAKVIQMSYYQDSEQMSRGYSSQVPAGQVNIYSVPFEIQEK